MQGEAAISIVAQTIPVIRVLLQPGGSSSYTASSTRRASRGRRMDAKTVTKGDDPAGADGGRVQSIALVQLPTGRIVPANSEEGRALARDEAAAAAAVVTQEEEEAAAAAAAVGSRDVPPEATDGQGEVPSDVDEDDEVHRIWQEMGLSRRAYSKSPSPSPGPRDASALAPTT